MKDADLLDSINELIDQRVVYLRHYFGTVLSLEPFQFYTKTVMRARVIIPKLGMIKPTEALACYPRDGRSSYVPQTGDTVEVYFMEGDPGKPVYMQATETSEQGFTNAAIVTNDVIYEERNNIFSILVNKIAGILQLGGPGAVKPASRVGDTVAVTIPAGTFLVGASGGVPNPTPVIVSGTITSGSPKVLITD